MRNLPFDSFWSSCHKTESPEAKGRTTSTPSHIMLPSTKAGWKGGGRTDVLQRAEGWES